MITKIKSIDNFAVFDGFRWDSCVKDSNGQTSRFDKLNILYGRNYSGKTTLSRILRSLELGALPDKYDNPKFEVVLNDNQTISQSSLVGHGLDVRVFNEDFVRANLRFLIDPDSEIAPFAILGADNSVLEREISDFEATLGSNEQNKESGKYLQLKNAKIEAAKAKDSLDTKRKDKDTKLSKKAIDKKIGIKYSTDKYGTQVQNYNITKLHDDIDKVLSSVYIDLTQKEKTAHEKTIKEQGKSKVNTTPCPELSFSQYCQDASELLSREIGASSKIQKLLLDSALNDWVRRGVELHDNTQICAFCDNTISDERRKTLHAHFDEESKKLEGEIDDLLSHIRAEAAYVSLPLSVDKTKFYSNYHNDIDAVIEQQSLVSKQYTDCLGQITSQLTSRKTQITMTMVFSEPADNTVALEDAFTKFKKICDDNDDYTSKLDKSKMFAQTALRLQDVKDYCVAIGYEKMLDEISSLESVSKNAEKNSQIIQDDIAKIKKQIKALQRQMNDEEAGARQVNGYLNNYFGHSFLTLQADRIEDGEVRIRFNIYRNNKPAYNLSEGECSLIAFCYFMAKLKDVDTNGKRPIIWIDDPVSSLDSNHIFFVYSLILSEIVKRNSFSQLFLSTHNLDFLKYLKRLNASETKPSGKTGSMVKRFFIINRHLESSRIEQMPKYLSDYATEYNYLFSKILDCSKIQNVDDSNFDLIVNFGNVARRFLEIHLYFKFPDTDDGKIHRFFANDEITAELINRLCNEGSHGSLEQAQRVGEIPEAIPAAKKIIEKIEEDNAQYNSLLKSIGRLT